jgi:DNA-binding GntR family transcriptional regulator
MTHELPGEPALIKRSKSLTEQAADAIRARIVDGELQLGEALSEIALAAELGVSKTPVREALLHLKQEGLVEVLPQRGTYVFQMNADQVRQLSELRCVLETAALAMAMAHRPADLAAELDAIVTAMDAAIGSRDAARYRTLDGVFHQVIVDLCGNGYLAAAYSGMAFRVQTLRNRLSLDPALNRTSLAEHLSLVRLIGAGDADQAAALLRRHIRGTQDHYLSILNIP